MLTMILAAAIAAPNMADDVPRGTDVAVRVETGRIAGDLRKMWADVELLLEAWPPVKRLSQTALETWTDRLKELETRTGADLERKTAVVTVTIDADAGGGPVFAAVIRGALSGGPAPDPGEDVEPFTVDGHPAIRHLPSASAWALVGNRTLVFGDERGMQRQLRRLLSKKRTKDEPVQILSSQLRKRAPFMMAFDVPNGVPNAVSEMLSTIGPLLGAVRSGTIVAHPGGIDLRVEAADEKGQKALEHGVHAFAALLRAGAALLEVGAEATLGLEKVGSRPPQLPESLGTETIEELLATWIKGAQFEHHVRRRRPHAVEATITPSSYRALAAALGVVAVGMAPPAGSTGKAEAQVMLMALRQAQLAYKAEKGEFLTCGPVPLEMPVGRVPWPEKSCFDLIGYRPPGDVRFQIATSTEEGTLVMMARGDADSDGVPEVWLLSETAPAIERFVPPSPDEGS